MATQYDPIAKDESLNTTELTPRNIADVLAEELARIVTALGGGSLEDLNDVAIVTPSNGQTLKYNSTTQKWENANDAGGHTIYDADESAMTQRAGLGFTDAHVSDNSGDDRTDVSLVQGITDANWALLDPTDESNNGFYQIGNSPLLHLGYVGNGEKKDFDAGAQSDYVEVDVTTSMTYGDVLLALFAQADFSRIAHNSVIELLGNVYRFEYRDGNYFTFTDSAVASGVPTMGTLAHNANGTVSAKGCNASTGAITDTTNTLAWKNGKCILYYNDSHTFDFNTKAENCIFDPTGTSLSSTNVEDAIKEVDGKISNAGAVDTIIAPTNSSSQTGTAFDLSAYSVLLCTKCNSTGMAVYNQSVVYPSQIANGIITNINLYDSSSQEVDFVFTSSGTARIGGITANTYGAFYGIRK